MPTATKNGEIPREPENVIFQHYLSGLIYSADFRTSGPKSHSAAQVLVPIRFCRQLVQGGHAAENHSLAWFCWAVSLFV